MPESTTYTVAEIIAMTKGETPWFDKVSDGWRHLKNAQDDISAFSSGSAPGWSGAIDSRWYIADTSSSTTTYTGSTTPSATGSDSLVAGYRVWFKAANNNTGAATLNVGSSDGATAIKKIVSGAKRHLMLMTLTVIPFAILYLMERIGSSSITQQHIPHP